MSLSFRGDGVGDFLQVVSGQCASVCGEAGDHVTARGFQNVKDHTLPVALNHVTGSV